MVRDPLITVLNDAEILDSEGIVGDFRTRIRINPRGVNVHLAYRGNATTSNVCSPNATFAFGSGFDLLFTELSKM